MGVIGFALVVESAGLHLILHDRHPVWAWLLTATSLSALWWIAADDRAMATGGIRLDAGVIEARIGRRVTFTFTRDAVARITRPRLMPAAGWPTGRLNATKPAAPNLEIVFRGPVEVQVLGRPRRVTELAVRVDDPDGLIAAWTT